jgi:hypothetical protein
MDRGVLALVKCSLLGEASLRRCPTWGKRVLEHIAIQVAMVLACPLGQTADSPPTSSMLDRLVYRITNLAQTPPFVA